ncbi:MAG: type II secretion system F family protein [PVC group bacterium]|nr:type II secretion system F family protein [PVC group bacterium]
MPVYAYKAKVKPDVFKTGTIEADSEKAAVNKLLQLNYHPISISQESEKRLQKYRLFQKLSSKDVYIFLRQLSNLISAGLPLAKALHNISVQSNNPKLRPIVTALKEKIQKGKTLSEAFADSPNVFTSLEISMIKSGETSGTLAAVITKIADLKENDIAFTTKIKNALAYPILLLVSGILMLFVLATFVFPRFISLFQDLGQDLPFITQVLITISLFMKKFWLLIIAGLVIMGTFFSGYLKTEQGKLWFDKLKFNIPIIKNVIIKIQISRFARTLGSLIENGVPILNSLQVVSEVASNKVFAQEIKNIHSQVAKGKHISETLKKNTVFDKNTLDLISVGEESGQLEQMLFRIAQMNESESTQQIESLVFMLEPTLILLLGGFIAFIVFAILLPIFEMNLLIQ